MKLEMKKEELLSFMEMYLFEIFWNIWHVWKLQYLSFKILDGWNFQLASK